MTEKKQLPKLFTILKIVGLALVVAGITLLICGGIKKVPSMGENGWFEAETTKSGLMFGGGVCIIISVFLLISGFMPNISRAMSKAHIQTTSQIVSENKDDLKAISNAQAEISADAITKTTKAIKDGFKDTMFCKYCGQEIDADSTFCKHCGKQL